MGLYSEARAGFGIEHRLMAQFKGPEVEVGSSGPAMSGMKDTGFVVPLSADERNFGNDGGGCPHEP